MNSTCLHTKTKHIIFIHLFFIILCLTFVLPFLIIISVSISSEHSIQSVGYSLLPKEIDLTAYKYVFNNPREIMNAYKATIFQSAVGTFLSVLVMSLCAYPLSRQSFIYRKGITFFIFFTMLFGGGLIPSYILITQYLKLGDSIWVYIFPTLASPWYIIILRTFFQGLPVSLCESAKIDGAGELRIFFQIILPLSKPVLATVALLSLLARWNDWMNSLLYIRSSELYTLQYLLQKILRETEFVKSMASQSISGISIQNEDELPTEAMRFAMCVVAAGPMLVVFPFFQKYFTQGLTVGAVKG